MLLRGFPDDATRDALAAGCRVSIQQGYIAAGTPLIRCSRRSGTTAIFFVAMTFMIGLMNFVLPLQLGVRDVAFPTLNSALASGSQPPARCW